MYGNFLFCVIQTHIDNVVKINNDEMTKEQTHELIKQAVLDYFRNQL